MGENFKTLRNTLHHSRQGIKTGTESRLGA